jgi:hypothetical protein
MQIFMIRALVLYVQAWPVVVDGGLIELQQVRMQKDSGCIYQAQLLILNQYYFPVIVECMDFKSVA